MAPVSENMRTNSNSDRYVLFRVDGGGYGVAMGHVFRCLRLARQLLAYQVKSCFCIQNNPRVRFLIESEGFQAVLLSELSDACATQTELAICDFVENVAGILYIDLRGEKKRLVDMARRRGIPVVVYDDVYEEGVYPSVLINPSEGDRSHYSGGGVEYMLGSQYVILDPSLRRFRKRQFAAHLDHIFICFGGADPCDVTARVIRAIVLKGFDCQISVALGPGYTNIKGLRSLANGVQNVVLYQGVNFLAPLMSKADAVISSGGTVMCEAIALALPVLVLPTIAHEVAIADAYKAEGLVASISCDVNSVEDALLGLAIDKFVFSSKGREGLFRAQAAEFRFNGCGAIAERIFQLLKTSGTQH
jgi:spore coat polysaccharide biosynthesis predicted glycosyltransferase SpsG